VWNEAHREQQERQFEIKQANKERQDAIAAAAKEEREQKALEDAKNRDEESDFERIKREQTAQAVSNAALDTLYATQTERTQLVDALAEMAASKKMMEHELSILKKHWKPPVVKQSELAALRSGITAASTKRIALMQSQLSFTERHKMRHRLFNQMLAICADMENPYVSLHDDLMEAKLDRDKAEIKMTSLAEETAVAKEDLKMRVEELESAFAEKAMNEKLITQAHKERQVAFATFDEMERVMMGVVMHLEDTVLVLEHELEDQKLATERIVTQVKHLVAEKAVEKKQKLRTEMNTFLHYYGSISKAINGWSCNIAGVRAMEKRDKVWQAQDIFWANAVGQLERQISNLERLLAASEARATATGGDAAARESNLIQMCQDLQKKNNELETELSHALGQMAENDEKSKTEIKKLLKQIANLHARLNEPKSPSKWSQKRPALFDQMTKSVVAVSTPRSIDGAHRDLEMADQRAQASMAMTISSREKLMQLQEQERAAALVAQHLDEAIMAGVTDSATFDAAKRANRDADKAVNSTLMAKAKLEKVETDYMVAIKTKNEAKNNLGLGTSRPETIVTANAAHWVYGAQSDYGYEGTRDSTVDVVNDKYLDQAKVLAENVSKIRAPTILRDALYNAHRDDLTTVDALRAWRLKVRSGMAGLNQYDTDKPVRGWARRRASLHKEIANYRANVPTSVTAALSDSTRSMEADATASSNFRTALAANLNHNNNEPTAMGSSAERLGDKLKKMQSLQTDLYGRTQSQQGSTSRTREGSSSRFLIPGLAEAMQTAALVQASASNSQKSTSRAESQLTSSNNERQSNGADPNVDLARRLSDLQASSEGTEIQERDEQTGTWRDYLIDK